MKGQGKIERLKFEKCKKCGDYDGSITKCFNICGKPMDALEEYNRLKGLEEQGLLLKLPCKVGDTLYVLTNDSLTGFEKTVCDRILVNKKSVVVQAPCQCDDWGKVRWNFKNKDFSQTVFLTQAEAEETLEMEVENEN